MYYNVTCKCGYRVEGLHTRKTAEVMADRHETERMLSAHKHDVHVSGRAK